MAKNHRILNSKGLSLIDTMIGLGLTAGILIGTMQMQTTMVRLQNTSTQVRGVEEIQRELTRRIGSRCPERLLNQQIGNPVTLNMTPLGTVGTDLYAKESTSRVTTSISAGSTIENFTVDAIDLTIDPDRPIATTTELQKYLVRITLTARDGTYSGTRTRSFSIPITAKLTGPAPAPISDCARPNSKGEQCLMAGTASGCQIEILSFFLLQTMCISVGLDATFCYPNTGGFTKAHEWIDTWRANVGRVSPPYNNQPPY